MRGPAPGKSSSSRSAYTPGRSEGRHTTAAEGLVERDAAAFAPRGETADRGEVGEAGVGVSDVGGEELPEAPLGAHGGGEERGRDGDRGGVDRTLCALKSVSADSVALYGPTHFPSSS